MELNNGSYFKIPLYMIDETKQNCIHPNTPINILKEKRRLTALEKVVSFKSPTNQIIVEKKEFISAIPHFKTDYPR
jgi:hypothetical protein